MPTAAERFRHILVAVYPTFRQFDSWSSSPPAIIDAVAGTKQALKGALESWVTQNSLPWPIPTVANEGAFFGEFPLTDELIARIHEVASETADIYNGEGDAWVSLANMEQALASEKTSDGRPIDGDTVFDRGRLFQNAVRASTAMMDLRGSLGIPQGLGTYPISIQLVNGVVELASRAVTGVSAFQHACGLSADFCREFVYRLLVANQRSVSREEILDAAQLFGVVPPRALENGDTWSLPRKRASADDARRPDGSVKSSSLADSVTVWGGEAGRPTDNARAAGAPQGADSSEPKIEQSAPRIRLVLSAIEDLTGGVSEFAQSALGRIASKEFGVFADNVGRSIASGRMIGSGYQEPAKSVAVETAKSTGAQASAKGALEVADGFAAVAKGSPTGAGHHFAAAGAYFVLAASAGAATGEIHGTPAAAAKQVAPAPRVKSGATESEGGGVIQRIAVIGNSTMLDGRALRSKLRNLV